MARPDAGNRAAAHAAVGLAIREGRMQHPDHCEACGVSGPTHAGRRNLYVHHHFSYHERYWLDTIPLCRTCHVKVHSGSIPEPRTGRMYMPRPRGTAGDDYAVWLQIHHGVGAARTLTEWQIAACKKRLKRAGALAVTTSEQARSLILRWHHGQNLGVSNIGQNRVKRLAEYEARRAARPTATPEA